MAHRKANFVLFLLLLNLFFQYESRLEVEVKHAAWSKVEWFLIPDSLQALLPPFQNLLPGIWWGVANAVHHLWFQDLEATEMQNATLQDTEHRDKSQEQSGRWYCKQVSEVGLGLERWLSD